MGLASRSVGHNDAAMNKQLIEGNANIIVLDLITHYALLSLLLKQPPIHSIQKVHCN